MKYLTFEQCLERYPRLARNLKWVAMLSNTEAGACIRDYRQGLEYSGEAVNHFGGTRKAIMAAIKARRTARILMGVQ